MSAQLRAAIGNPDEYRHTGHSDKVHNSMCPCGVQIVNRFEIIHETTGAKFMIGSVCAKRVGIYVGKLCDTCHEPNKMRTPHCQLCRRKCPLHKKFHDSNIIHSNMKFSSGKHKGSTPDEILGVDDGYLIWVVDQTNWSNSDQRQYIINELLGRCCQKRFKKYPDTPLGQLKLSNPEYFEYMRSADRGCYLEFV